MEVKIVLKKAGGDAMEFVEMHSMVIDRKWDKPAESLSFVLPGVIKLAGYERVQVLYDKVVVFSGVVDKVQGVLSDTGNYTKVECRSLAALLLDREAKPQTWYNVGISRLLGTYIDPHPFDVAIPEQPLPMFTVGKGVSCWDVLELYCAHAFGKRPLVIEQNLVVVSYNTMADPYQLHTTGNTDYEITHVAESYNYRDLVTRVYTKVDTAYTKVHNNSEAGNSLTKERYLDPSIKWAGKLDMQAKLLIDEGNLRAHTMTVKIPSLTMLSVGCRLYFSSLPTYPNKCYQVLDMREEVGGNKVETTVVMKEVG